MIVPALVASGFLALQANELLGKAATAEQVEQEVAFAVAVGAMLDSAEGERSLSFGLTSVGQLGVTTDELRASIGYDLYEEMAFIRNRFDQELKRIDFGLASPELREAVELLPQIRAEVDAGTASPGQVENVYHKITVLGVRNSDAALDRSVANLGKVDAAHLVKPITTVGTLNEVALDGVDWIGDAYLVNFLPNRANALDLAGRSAELTGRVEKINAGNPRFAAVPQWRAVADGAGTGRNQYIDLLLRRTDGADISQAELQAVLNEVGPAERERWNDLQTVTDILANEAAVDLRVVAERAKRSAYSAASAAVGLLVILITASFYYASRMSRSVKALETRAQRISAGDLTAAVTDANPPQETDAVHRGLDDLIEVLTALNDQARALAEGRLDDDVLQHSAGGALGQAFAASIESVRRTAADLRDSEEVAHTIIDAASDCIVLITDNGRVDRYNPAAELVVGQDRLDAGDADDILPGWRDLVGQSSEVELTDAVGDQVQVLVSGSQFSTDEGPVAVLIWRDITERKNDEDRLRKLAHNDALTGLLNRAGLMAALAHRVADGEQTSVIYMDLDQFKPLNDVYGHEVGDFVLSEVGRRLSASARFTDQVARIGGDEFVVLSDAAGDVVEALALRLIESVGQEITLPSGVRSQILCSAGWASGARVSGSELLRRADVALYAAKASRNRSVVAFDDTIAQRDEHCRQVEKELAAGIAQGELRLHAQPIVDMASGAVTGAEVLVRWQHPERGLLYPDSFIPIAERSDLIIDIDRWVLAEAVRTVTSMPQPVVVSVNVSGRYLRRLDLVDFMRDLLAGNPVDPDRLQVEVTETHEGIGTEVAAEVAHKLRELGLRIALDDFGTGFSSLTHLLQMPTQTIKIDRSMVLNRNKPEGSGVIGAIVGYGLTQNVGVVAEGVETAQEVHWLLSRGCRLGQGYFYSPPTAMEDFLLLLRDGLRYRAASQIGSSDGSADLLPPAL